METVNSHKEHPLSSIGGLPPPIIDDLRYHFWLFKKRERCRGAVCSLFLDKEDNLQERKKTSLHRQHIWCLSVLIYKVFGDYFHFPAFHWVWNLTKNPRQLCIFKHISFFSLFKEIHSWKAVAAFVAFDNMCFVMNIKITPEPWALHNIGRQIKATKETKEKFIAIFFGFCNKYHLMILPPPTGYP